ncbi:MAG: hypothetical protein WKG01_05900 [Kofleriaceae bacterium]
MTKDSKRSKKKQRHAPADGGPPHWERLYDTFREAFEWALDVAAKLARDFPEEAEAVERVRAYMRKRLAGEPAHVCIDDVLLTFGLMIGAIDRDLVRGLVREFTADVAHEARTAARELLAPLQLPGAPGWEPRIPRHFTIPSHLAFWLGLDSLRADA